MNIFEIGIFLIQLGRGNVLQIHQDAYISRGDISEGKILEYKKYRPENGVYVFVISGNIEVGEYTLSSRDAVGVVNEETLSIQAKEQSDVLLLEVPMV